MKPRNILLYLAFSIVFCKIIFSQQIYFNNRYNMCQDYNEEAWSAALDIVETSEGYAFEGATVDTSTYWMRRIAIFVIDSYGYKLYEKSYGNDSVDFYKGWPGSFRKSPTGEQYYLAGSKNYWQPTNFDVGMVMKLDSSFDTLWTKEYNLNLDDNRETSLILNNIEFCDNSDLILSGSKNGAYMFLMRTDSNGITKWYKNFHYGGNTLCLGYTAIQTSDAGFALGGFQYTIGQEETGNPVIVKTDSLGNQQWVKYMGGPMLDGASALVKSIDNYIIMGSVYGDEMVGHEARSRINIAKLDNDGNVLWDKKFGRTIYNNNLLNIKVLSDGSILACGSNAGYYSSDMGWIIKVDENGDSLWYREYALLAGTSSINRLWALIETSDNGIAACGDIIPMPSDTGITEAWVIKLDSIGCEYAGCDSTVGITEQGSWEAGKQGGLELWPNPCGEILHGRLNMDDGRFYRDLALKIYDIYGRTVTALIITSPMEGGVREGGWKGSQSWQINVSSCPSGIYFFSVLENGRRIAGDKFVVAR